MSCDFREALVLSSYLLSTHSVYLRLHPSISSHSPQARSPSQSPCGQNREGRGRAGQAAEAFTEVTWFQRCPGTDVQHSRTEEPICALLHWTNRSTHSIADAIADEY